MHFIYHNLSAEDPFKLSWKCRPLMLRQKDEYDYFIYSEDDIIFNRKNFIYWLKFKNMCKKNRLNLGFLRTEVSNKDKKLVSTDQNKKLTKYLLIRKKRFAILNNPYCAMWIYDQQEFKKFIRSKFWDLNDWRGVNAFTRLYTREKSAVGWHGLNMNRYLATVIPINRQKVHPGSLIRHQSNNYASGNMIDLKINNILSKNLKFFKPIQHSKIDTFIKEVKFFVYLKFRFNFKNLKKIFT